MKSLCAVMLLMLAGCLSVTESNLDFVSLKPAGNVRFYIDGLKLSEALAALSVGESGSVSARCEKIRDRLVRNSSGMFTCTSEGAVPLKVAIHAYKNGNGQFNRDMTGENGVYDSGFTSIFMLQRIKAWTLTYEIKCEIGEGAGRQTVVKNVNSNGLTEEPNLIVAPVMLVMAPFFDNVHVNGIELFPGMVDGYDWLMEKEFADVMASAVAEFDIDAIKAKGDGN